MAETSKAETLLCGSLRLILEQAETGGPLWTADYGSPAIKKALNALEFFLPALLRQEYPSWNDESLDYFKTLSTQKLGPRSLELTGGALLITDQRWTPFALVLGLTDDMTSIEWFDLKLGSPGPDKQGLDRHFRYQDKDEALREFERHWSQIPWVFTLSAPRP